MLKQAYKREMDAISPKAERLEQLYTQLKEGQTMKKELHLGRRAVAAVAVCAALLVAAVAAGPTVWEAIQARLGAFAPYAAPAAGTAVDQGLEVALAGSLSDGYVAKVYFTVTDPAGRLNEHTQISAQLAMEEELGGAMGCRVLSWDQEAGQMLVEASAVGVGSGSAAALEITAVDPGERYIQEALFQPPALAEPLNTETTAAGNVVLKANQTPQASPDTADFSVSSMGFDGEGRFHIRLEMAEGFDAGWLLAMPYNAAGEQMGTTLDEMAVDGGMDFVIGDITPADWADMTCIRVYGAYRGPEAAIKGSWILPVTLEPAEERTLTLDRQAGPYRLDTLELSPLSAALTWEHIDGGQGRDYWVFTQPLELEEVASVTIAGETFPVE